MKGEQHGLTHLGNYSQRQYDSQIFRNDENVRGWGV